MVNVSRILVVGAGPAGLTLSLKLARAGISPTLVDAADGPASYSRAILLQARSLEVLGFSLAKRIADLGQVIHSAKVLAAKKEILQLPLGSGIGLFEYPISISQPELESLIIDELSQLGVQVHWGTKVTGLSGTQAPTVSFSDGRTETFDFVIGADGAQSTVRQLAGIQVNSLGSVEHWIAADLEIASDDLPRDRALMSLDQGRITALFPQGKTNLFRLVRTSKSGDEQSDSYWADVLQEFDIFHAPAVLWSSRYAVHEQAAQSMRKDRVFLVGDAAHSHSPIGGQGMNLGILEANNLAWKLALVSGGANERILDTYAQERSPYAALAMTKAAAAFRSVKIQNSLLTKIRSLLLGASALGPVRDYLTSAITRQSERYPAHGLNQEFFDSVQVADWDELPEQQDIDDYQDAPGAGMQLEPESEELWRLLDHGKFTVFVLDGRANSQDGIDRVRATLEYLKRQPQFVTHLITSHPNDFAGHALIPDESLLLHAEFGAKTESVFVVRPDGHIGFRSSPIDITALEDWWEEILEGEFL